MKLYDEKREELYHISGDMDHGLAVDLDLTKTALGKPMVRYKDRIMQAEVYPSPDKKGLMVHIHCPRCTHVNVIRTERKHIEYDPETNDLSIEPYECTWELGDRDNERIAFGIGLCRLRIAIDHNIAKDV